MNCNSHKKGSSFLYGLVRRYLYVVVLVVAVLLACQWGEYNLYAPACLCTLRFFSTFRNALATCTRLSIASLLLKVILYLPPRSVGLANVKRSFVLRG